jgi:hypothetical protein
MKKTFSMAPECCAMGLSSVRVDTGGGGFVQTKMRFFTIFGGRIARRAVKLQAISCLQ